ncbi:MAG: hypothetical protein ACRD6W_11370 [Nitrososphaerales archaeon]
MAASTRRIALGALFGVLILVINGFIPAPTSDFLIVFQSLFLALSYLVVGRGGASYVGVVSGLLITSVKVSFFPVDLVFATMFGVLVDILATALSVQEDGRARSMRLMVCMMVSTGVVGLAAFYVSVIAFPRVFTAVPHDPITDLTILVFGVVSGAIAGAIGARIWNRNLMARFYNRY